jgi:lysozyme
MKATEGGTFIDKRFAENWGGATRVEVARGAYHVFGLCSDAKAQFENILRVVPKQADAMPMVVDLEWFTRGPFSVRYEKCKDIKNVRKKLRTLLELLEKHYQKRPMLFAHENGIREVLSDKFNDYALWLQDWTRDGSKNQDGPKLSGRNPWTIWQYAGNTNIASLKNIDVNAFFGSVEQFEDFKAGRQNVALQAAVDAR